MTWEVVGTEEFRVWYERDLSEEQRDAVTARVDVLEAVGPTLGRPIVDTIAGSEIPNLKELRASQDGALRVLFVFDPYRRAVLLLGGDKTGQWREWYEEAIPRAEVLYKEYLEEVEEER